MKYLEFDIKNMAISRTAGDKTALISGAVNYFGLHFNFGDEFAEIPGTKSVEFYKNRNKIRVDLVDNQCAVPNELLTDNKNFEMRVISGNTIGTTWTSVGITESGIVMPEEPEEEAPSGMEYVKTASGENAAPYLRASTNGLEYSQNGEDWNSGVSGVPEVPSRPKGSVYLRKNGDWVNAEEYLAENGGETNVINEVQVDGTALPVTDKSVNIDLSAYAKTADLASEYATKTEVAALQTLTGTAETVTDVDYSTTDISDVITSYNALLSALRARGVIA
ncbi:hypothetical protein C810_01403 [Lachnospiraceae bacterium A2]|nr:hypothetical protein C810_01403 [Lachnospiraceae bacterium A2]